jgi:hypothetical protein
MKTQFLSIKGSRVRKSTIAFAQALLDSGVKVVSLYRTASGDRMTVRGRRRFGLSVFFNYDTSCLAVNVLTRKGHLQSVAECKTANEFRVLLKVRGIAD